MTQREWDSRRQPGRLPTGLSFRTVTISHSHDVHVVSFVYYVFASVWTVDANVEVGGYGAIWDLISWPLWSKDRLSN